MISRISACASLLLLLHVFISFAPPAAAAAVLVLPLVLNPSSSSPPPPTPLPATSTSTHNNISTLLTPNTTLPPSIPAEYTVPVSSPPLRILTSPPSHRQQRIPLADWTAAIIATSEEIASTIHAQGLGAQLPPQGRTFGSHSPGKSSSPVVALRATPWFGVYGRFYYLTLSTAVSAIWQIVLESECRTWSFEVMMGQGRGLKQGAHVGSVVVEYYGRSRRLSSGGGGGGGSGVP